MHSALVIAGVILLAAGIMLSRGAPNQVDELGLACARPHDSVTAALVGGHVAGRFGQAAVLGELLAGMVLGGLAGTTPLHFIAADPYLDILAQIGMLLLLFEVGLDLSVRDLFAVGPSSLLVASVGNDCQPGDRHRPLRMVLMPARQRRPTCSLAPR